MPQDLTRPTENGEGATRDPGPEARTGRLTAHVPRQATRPAEAELGPAVTDAPLEASAHGGRAVAPTAPAPAGDVGERVFEPDFQPRAAPGRAAPTLQERMMAGELGEAALVDISTPEAATVHAQALGKLRSRRLEMSELAAGEVDASKLSAEGSLPRAQATLPSAQPPTAGSAPSEAAVVSRLEERAPRSTALPRGLPAEAGSGAGELAPLGARARGTATSGQIVAAPQRAAPPEVPSGELRRAGPEAPSIGSRAGLSAPADPGRGSTGGMGRLAPATQSRLPDPGGAPLRPQSVSLRVATMR